MRFRQILCGLLLFEFWFRFAAAQDPVQHAQIKSQISPTAWAACEAWLNASEQGGDDWRPATGTRLETLLKEPDADLCLLYMLDEWALGSSRGGGAAPWAAPSQLGKLSTQRTFEILSSRLTAKDAKFRGGAIDLLGEFKRTASVDPLLNILQHDSDSDVRCKAAKALSNFDDKRIVPALLNAELDPPVCVAAGSSLAELKCNQGLQPLLPFVKHTFGGRDWDEAVEAVSKYHSKAAVKALIDVYGEIPAPIRSSKGYDVQYVIERLRRFARGTESELGATPDDYLDEWQEWWQRAEPMMTDDLQLIDKIVKEHSIEEFGNKAEDLPLRVAVDSKTYRLKDPIRIDVTLKNISEKPYRVMEPCLNDAGLPKALMLVRIMRDNKLLFETDPNGYRSGSFHFLPSTKVIAPSKQFHSSTCLQSVLGSRVQLAEGDYELELTFVPENYHSKPSDGEVLGPWKSNQVQFTIKGEARTDPKEILDLIAQKSELKFLRRDLSSG